MKNLLSLFFVSIFSLGYAQDQNQPLTAAVSTTQSSLVKATESGEFVFVLNQEVSDEVIQHSAQYYKLYFTVDYLKKDKQIKIKMKENTSDNRKIIVRFFVSAQIEKITYNGVDYEVMDFYEKFLQ